MNAKLFTFAANATRGNEQRKKVGCRSCREAEKEQQERDDKGKRSLNPGNSREKMRDLVEGMAGEEKFQWHSRKILELDGVIFLASSVSKDQR